MPKYEIDKLADRISHDKMGFLKRVRFCPSCGGPHLEDHGRTLDPFGKPIQGKELWCVLCGFSFNVRASVEWNLALRMFKEHRKFRAGATFKEKDVDPEIVKAWKVKYERPVFRPASTWNLADKLKAAMKF